MKKSSTLKKILVVLSVSCLFLTTEAKADSTPHKDAQGRIDRLEILSNGRALKFQYDNNQSYYQHYYDSNGHLASDELYENGVLLARTVYKDDPNSDSQLIDHIIYYNPQGRIDRLLEMLSNGRALKFQYYYDSNGVLTRVDKFDYDIQTDTDVQTGTRRYYYLPNGHLASDELYENGVLVARTSYKDNPNPDSQLIDHIIHYDSQGRISRTEQFEYGSNGQVIEDWKTNIYYANKISQTQRRVEFYHNGKLARINWYYYIYEYPDGRPSGWYLITSSHYDPQGRVLRSKLFKYDLNGQILASEADHFYYVNETSETLERVETYRDGKLEAISHYEIKRRPDGDGYWDWTTNIRYDSQGRVFMIETLKSESDLGRLVETWKTFISYPNQTSKTWNRIEFSRNGRTYQVNTYHTDEYRSGGRQTLLTGAFYYNSKGQKIREYKAEYEFLTGDSRLTQSKKVRETETQWNERGVQTGQRVAYFVDDWNHNGRLDDNDIRLFHEIATGNVKAATTEQRSPLRNGSLPPTVSATVNGIQQKQATLADKSSLPKSVTASPQLAGYTRPNKNK